MRTASRNLSFALATLMALGSVPALAQGHHGGWRGGDHDGGHYGGHYRGGWRSGPGWGGVGIGLGLGIGLGALAYGSYYGPGYGSYYDPYYPGYVVVQTPPAVTYVTPSQPAEPAAAAAPDPVIYPRNGQGAQQTEADRQACNRWATTVPSAMADAAVFQRAIEACMDARGYTVR